jgi:hypothetical protein
MLLDQTKLNLLLKAMNMTVTKTELTIETNTGLSAIKDLSPGTIFVTGNIHYMKVVGDPYNVVNLATGCLIGFNPHSRVVVSTKATLAVHY